MNLDRKSFRQRLPKIHSQIHIPWSIIACFLFTVLFLVWPNLDLLVASQFYNGEGFPLDKNPLIQLIYQVFAKIHILYLLGFLAAIAFFSVKKQLQRRRNVIFLLLCLLFGPGLLVNVGLKDNSLGRPRPEHIQMFGGNMEFAPTFHYSGECTKNCSFVSGHASIGFYLFSLAWITRRRTWLIYGIALGSVVGFTRIVQGGHFLSDVIFAGWATYFTCALINKFYLKSR